MIQRVLASSRFFVALAVLGSFISSVTLLVYGSATVVRIAWGEIRHADPSIEGAQRLAVEFIELTDIFLLGTVLIIVALGLYQLFIDAALPVPAWLRVDSLDQLKSNLVGVVIVLLGVSFLGFVVRWDGDDNILALGGAVALVIAALGGFFVALQRLHDRAGQRASRGTPPPGDPAERRDAV